MTISKIIARTGAALLVGCISTQAAFAEEGLGLAAPEDGAVDVTRQCDVYVAGVATTARPGPLKYRWLDGAIEVSPWMDVRADRSAPLDLCGLSIGRHALTLEITDGKRTVSGAMTADIVTAPALVARADSKS